MSDHPPALRTRTTVVTPFALAVIAGPLLLALAWIWLGSIVPAVATPFGVEGGWTGTVTSPISGLGVGPHAALFNAAFILSGLLTAAGVVGAFPVGDAPGRSRRNAIGLALSPLGFAVAGVFPLSGSVPAHMAGFLLVSGTPVVTFVTAGRFLRTVPGWERLGRWLIVGSPVTLALVAWFFAAFDQDAIASGHGVAGIPSRALAVVIGAFFVAIGGLALRHHSAAPVEHG